MVQLTPARVGVVPGTRRLAGGTTNRLGGAGLVAVVVAVQVLILTALALLWPGQLLGRILLVAVAMLALHRAGVFGYHGAFPSWTGHLSCCVHSSLRPAPLQPAWCCLGSEAAAIDVLTFWTLAGVASWLGLALSYAIGRVARASGWFIDRAVVLGTGEVAERLEYALATRPEFGLDLIGSVTDDPMQSPASLVLGTPPDQLDVVCRGTT